MWLQLNCFEKTKFFSIPSFDFDLILGSFLTFGALTGYFWGWGKGSKTVLGSPRLITFVSEFCSISALSCSLEFVWWCGWYSQRLLSLINPTAVMVVLMLGLWLLLGCDN